MISAPSSCLGFVKVSEGKYINPKSIIQIEHNIPSVAWGAPKTENIVLSLESKNFVEITDKDIREKGMSVDKVIAKAQEAATTGKIIDLYS